MGMNATDSTGLHGLANMETKLILVYLMARTELLNTRLQLAIATLTSTFGLAAFFTRSKPADKAQGPPINAKNKDEESFVKYVDIRETADAN